MAGSGALTDWILLGVLASRVPRDAVDVAIVETGKGALRAGGKLPPHVMVYFVMALALFADDDYAPYFLLDQVQAPRAEHPAWTAQVCLEQGVAGFVFVTSARGSHPRITHPHGPYLVLLQCPAAPGRGEQCVPFPAADEGERPAAGAGDAARWFLPVGPDRPSLRREIATTRVPLTVWFHRRGEGLRTTAPERGEFHKLVVKLICLCIG